MAERMQRSQVQLYLLYLIENKLSYISRAGFKQAHEIHGRTQMISCIQALNHVFSDLHRVFSQSPKVRVLLTGRQ